MEQVTDFSLKKDFIRKQACFLKLTDIEVEKLAELLVEKHMPAGTTVVTEGEPVDSVYLIVKGEVDIRKLIIKPDHTTDIKSVATLGPGTAIGLNETGFYSLSGLRTATVVAITDLVLLYLNIASFHGFALENPHVNEVMRSNARKIIES